MSIDGSISGGKGALSAMVSPADATGPFERTAWRIGENVSSKWAEEVDAQSRFPFESVAEFRTEGLLAAMVPTELGGGGAILTEVAGAVRALAFHCPSSALVLAMHSVEVGNLVRYGSTPELRELLAEIATGQVLIANGNSEVGVGGDVGRSVCAVTPADSGLRLDKQCLAISYGEYADVIFTVARRSPDAPDTDRVLVGMRRAQYTLEPLNEWNTTGLRGTCSRGFRLSAEVDPGLVFAEPFAEVVNHGGAQSSLILLSAVCVGVAESAAARAHAYVRAAARKQIGVLPQSAMRLAELAAQVQQCRDVLGSAVMRFELSQGTPELENPGYFLALRNLKVSASELSVEIATAALRIVGIAGYSKTSPFSLDRIVRDALGGMIMVSNDRYLQDNAHVLVLRKSI